MIQAVCERLPAGVRASVADIERVADRFLASDRVVALAVGERPAARDDVLRRRDGRVVATLPTERVYSTPELLALEQRIIRHALESQDARVGIARTRAVDRAIAARPTIAGEQAVMVRRLTEEGAGVAVVVGEAGTGKTFALGAAREAWEASGRRVIGVAIARRAARELELDAGISSTSVAALLEQLRRRPVSAIPLRAVLVVDEAGMVSTRQLAALVDHAAARRAKLVLVGDHRQLPELEAGGAFRALTTRLPAIELHENRRQVEGWERSALALLRDGSVEQALQRYQDRGRVVVKDDAADLRRQLVADWWAARDPEGAVMIAYRRADVVDLNGRARALMRAAGALGETELRLAGWVLRSRRSGGAPPQRPSTYRGQRRPWHRARRGSCRGQLGCRRRRPPGPARRRIHRAFEPAQRSIARAWLRHHRPQRPRNDLPRGLRPRAWTGLARVGLHRAEPRA